MSTDLADRCDWSRGAGLVPAIVQDAATLRVLMLGYMDATALRMTLQTGRVTFWSRSRARHWTKGETSGHGLRLVGVDLDCDGDALLVTVRPEGPTCHLGTRSCFPKAPADGLAELDALVASRQRERAEGSYTASLFDRGVHRIAQKVGEEGVETALAGVADDDAALVGEVADLLYHVVVLLRARGLSLGEAIAALDARAKGSLTSAPS